MEQVKNGIDVRCFQDTRTLNEFLDDFNREYNTPAGERDDEQYLYDYNILYKAQKALDYVRASTSDKAVDGNFAKFQIVSLMNSKEEYARAITILTANNNPKMMYEMDGRDKNTIYHSDLIPDEDDFFYMAEAPLYNPEIKQAIAEYVNGQDILNTKTVADLAEVIALTEAQRVEYLIRDVEIIDDTLLTIANEKEKLHVLTKATNIKEKPQVVESNDGYVMNTSAPITAANEKQVDVPIENGNEVHQSTAKETTNNLADTRPNVQFEQANSVGTKEKAEIDSGYGTDSDIEKMADSNRSYEPQTDRSYSSSTKGNKGEER